MVAFFKKKVKSILTDEDNLKLREIERSAYMHEAEKLIMERGIKRAREDLGTKEKPKDPYNLN